MPRHEPSRRQTAGEPPPARVKMRLEGGRFVPVEEEPEDADERAPAPEESPGGETAGGE